MHTGIEFNVNMEKEGFYKGDICAPFSVNRSPYFQVRTPVWRWKGGSGVSVIILGGNHGDEYEGPLALFKFIKCLKSSVVNGAITIIPLLNGPATQAGKRCSPLDGGNMNRSFPGRYNGTPTERMAYFLEHKLFPMHDLVFDIHSGGTSMEHISCGLTEINKNTKDEKNQIDAMKSLGLNYGFITDNGTDSPTTMGAASRAGILGVSGEFGGGGTVTPTSITQTVNAIDNILMHCGIIKEHLLSDRLDVERHTEILELCRKTQFIYANQPGWFEPAVNLYDSVVKGQIAGYLFDVFNIETDPTPYYFEESGLVISRRLPVVCEMGDCLFNIAAVQS